MATSSRGPVPKRSDQRRRRNGKSAGTESNGPERVQAGGGDLTAMPDPDPQWHDAARNWYLSLAESGQAEYYEPSDWWTAYYLAEAMHRNLSSGKFSAQLFQAVMSGMTELLTTEGARRRASVELERRGDEEPSEDENVARMDDFRNRLSG